jgi:hypothetical protein
LDCDTHFQSRAEELEKKTLTVEMAGCYFEFICYKSKKTERIRSSTMLVNSVPREVHASEELVKPEIVLKPLLKWAGGKRWLVPHLLPLQIFGH